MSLQDRLREPVAEHSVDRALKLKAAAALDAKDAEIERLKLEVLNGH